MGNKISIKSNDNVSSLRKIKTKDEEYYVDSKGVKQGLYIKYKLGKKYIEYNYVNDLLEGECKEYYSPSGNIYKKYNCCRNFVRGEYTTYDDLGNVQFNYIK